MFEGYLDWSTEAKRKGRDASRALCICRFGNDALDCDVCFWSQVSYVLRAASTDERQSLSDLP
jgi:hypothetical protein